MSKDKRSFFERLAGSVMVEDTDLDEEEDFEDEEEERNNKKFLQAKEILHFPILKKILKKMENCLLMFIKLQMKLLLKQCLQE